jgi:hypothetical protein
MKTVNKFAMLGMLLLFAFSIQAQFSTSSSGTTKKDDNSTHEFSRQQDISLLQQKAKTMEQDVLNKNTEQFDKYKREVLAIMNREIVRSTNDLAQLKYKLKKVDGGRQSQQGRALQIEINQMDGRVGRQKLVRASVNALTKEKINVDNAKELASLKTQYFQFIDTMQANMKYSQKPSSSQSGSSGKTGTGNSTSAGSSTPNQFYSSSKDASKKKTEQELPASYYYSKDKKEAENYLRTKKNTASALAGNAQEIQLALNRNSSREAEKLEEELKERMGTDITSDKRIVGRLSSGGLKYSGLNAGMIKSKLAKKENLYKKINALQLSTQKSQFFSLVNQYIQLLK